MNIAICMCVYNNEPRLIPVIQNIRKLIPLFNEVKIIVAYSHSQDNSLNILLNNTENLSVEIINVNIIPNVNKTRNISNARNALVQRIRDKYSHFHYFIMMDANEYSCIGEINVDLVKETLNRCDEWDAISFNREAGYYDHWALSISPYVYSFCHFVDARTAVTKMRHYFNPILDDFAKNKPNEYIDVLSSFDGFSIYKTNKFIDCHYSDSIVVSLFPPNSIQQHVQTVGINILPYPYTEFDCEHRHFHLQAIQKNGAKIKLCPKFMFKKINPPNPYLRGPA
jgi:glycosyltransferase involved in cell wall biosynthesis